MSIRICTYDDMLLDPQPVRLPKLTRLVCPACGKQFSPPRYSDGGIVSCQHCGHQDFLDDEGDQCSAK